ncbi:histone-lysine N-methyltransferase SETMAR [Trichonephila clavipes]|nr:histone-lysine N-methyltransferase SETMAR [Trichonephila clavipes]
MYVAKHVLPKQSLMQNGSLRSSNIIESDNPSQKSREVVFLERRKCKLVAEIAHGVYGADTVIANYRQFWFRRFRSGIFDVKDAPHTGRPVIENAVKISEIIEVDRPVSSRSIVQELKIDNKTVLSHLRKVGFKKKPHVWVHTN